MGNGIAAHAFLWTYAKMLKEHHLDVARRVIWLKSEIFPTCSLTSTSLISRAGLQYGVSELGDNLLRSYEIFEENFSHHPCVTKAIQQHIEYGDSDNFKQRYADAPAYCYLIDADSFLQELANDFDHLVEVKTGTVLAYDSTCLTLHSGERIQFDRCFLGLGACNNLIAPISGTRAVAGQYAQCSVDLGADSFVISKGPHNLLYNAKVHQLMVGSLDDKEDQNGFPVVAARANALKELLSSFNYELPLGLKWHVFSGVRHKGQKRRPYWGNIKGQVDGAHSLYKNGYTLAWLAAQEVAAKWIKL